ncbi:MAG: AI-2E family transporter [Pseudomonadota bacterium]|nr:AI-2E family transporter [Pseudomonadota bacterium]
MTDPQATDEFVQADPTLAPSHQPRDEALQPDPERVLLHMPVDVRSLSLAILAALGVLFAMRWASPVLIPLMLGVMLSYALSPIVDRLHRWRVPRAAGAALLLLAIVGGLGWTAYTLSDDATALLESLPEATQKIRQTVLSHRNPSESTIDKVQKAATQLEQVAQESGRVPATTARGVTRVRIERPQFDIKDYVWTGTLGLAASIGQATVVLFIAFFLMASGDTFRRKLVKIVGPTFARRKITVQALDEITSQIQRYLLVQLFMSVCVGVVTWVAYLLIGVQHAAVWGAAACVLNFVPYLGSIAFTAASALVGFVQFSSVDMAALIAGVSLIIHTLAGHLITPWLTSRTSQMNAVAVFVGVLAFGWLWGLWGLLLGVPVLMMVKAVCDRVDDLKPMGELLGS